MWRSQGCLCSGRGRQSFTRRSHSRSPSQIWRLLLVFDFNKNALAYLECRVDNRMECGDRRVVYAVAEGGKVLHEGVTAVHHRKSGGYY
jgi:hypothetical protein